MQFLSNLIAIIVLVDVVAVGASQIQAAGMMPSKGLLAGLGVGLLVLTLALLAWRKKTGRREKSTVAAPE